MKDPLDPGLALEGQHLEVPDAGRELTGLTGPERAGPPRLLTLSDCSLGEPAVVLLPHERLEREFERARVARCALARSGRPPPRPRRRA